MTVIIRDGKFCEDEWLAAGGAFIPLDHFDLETHERDPEVTGLDIPNSTDAAAIEGLLELVSAIRIPFPSFADGRGFSIAKRLRQMGYQGLLRANGHILADQYPLALRSGFDEIELPAPIAGRQPEKQWRDNITRVENNYQDRLSGRNSSARISEKA